MMTKENAALEMTKSGIKGRCTRRKGKDTLAKIDDDAVPCCCWWCHDVKGGHHVREYRHSSRVGRQVEVLRVWDWPGPTLPGYDSKETVRSNT